MMDSNTKPSDPRSMRQVRTLVKRAPEEELMDLPAHAQAYASADFSEPNSKFVALFSEKFPGFNGQQIIDLGCGPADITMRLAEQYLDRFAALLERLFFDGAPAASATGKITASANSRSSRHHVHSAR